MHKKEFRDFVRSVIALPFLPIDQIEAAINKLRLMDMDMDEKMSKFQEYLLDYMEGTWVRRSFAPKLLNMWRKAADLTKTSYNSHMI